MIHVGVIGYGYWGPNLARNFSEIPGSEVVRPRLSLGQT